MPLEGVIETVRRDIDVGLVAIGGRVSTFRISFTYPDARKAQTVANVLISKFIEESVVERIRRTTTREQQLMEAIAQLQSRVEFLERRAGVGMGRANIDPPSLPTHPMWPDRNRFMAMGKIPPPNLALAIVAFRPRGRAAPPMPA
jgi:hypothetical protein